MCQGLTASSSMVEHLTVNQGVGGSSPPLPAKSGGSSVWSEFLVWNQGVAGSNPALQTTVLVSTGLDQ